MPQLIPKLFTLLKAGYTWADFRADFIAGLVVAVVALPLAMAFGIASGASPDKGLTTAIVAGFIMSLLSGSRVQIGGPTGAFVVIIFHVIAAHGYDGLILATFMAGLILVLAGYMRLGRFIQKIPAPVITGFTAGIAVIIASSQVKDFFGLDIASVPADFLPKWAVYFGALDTISLPALAIGVLSILAILGLRKISPKFPALLAAVVLASLLAALAHMPVETIGQRFPDMPRGLPAPQAPVADFAKMLEVIPAAFTIAFLAGIEALLSAVVADGRTGFKHRSNQELIAQGVANISSAMFGGLPATGAIARTATNIEAGAKTPISGMLHAIFLLIFILAAADLIKFIPLAALAAILFLVAWRMSEIDHFMATLKASWRDKTLLLVTFALTVMVDLTTAIFAGVALAVIFHFAQKNKAT